MSILFQALNLIIGSFLLFVKSVWMILYLCTRQRYLVADLAVATEFWTVMTSKLFFFLGFHCSDAYASF